MKAKINLIYNQCEDWSSQDIDRLISELTDLSNMKVEAEQDVWTEAGENINNFLTINK